MENAVDAIVMAGEVLIFIVALTVCITSLNTLKDTLDRIIGEDETIELVSTTTSSTDENGVTTTVTQYANYIASKQENATRLVGPETVVTSMYRALKEEYTLYIKFNGDTTKRIENIMDDLSNDIEDIFIKASYSIDVDGDGVNEITANSDKLLMVGQNETLNVTSHLNEILGNGLYNIIKDCVFYEYLGEYQEVKDTNSANKSTYRIITYIQK